MPTPPIHQLDNSTKVAMATALLWSPTTRTNIYHLLRKLDLRSDSGRAFTQDEVKLELQDLVRKRQLIEVGKHQGYYQLIDRVRLSLYEALLDHFPASALQSALFEIVQFRPEFSPYSWPLYNEAATAAVVRLYLLTGKSAAGIRAMADMIGRTLNWPNILNGAYLYAFYAPSHRRIDVALQWDLAYLATITFCATWDTRLHGLVAWAKQQSAATGFSIPIHVGYAIAEYRLHCGERVEALGLIQGVDEGFADALRAYGLVQESRWPEAQALFEVALKKCQSTGKAKKRLLPVSIAWLYPLALLAQAAPAQLELARKFCIGEAGKRDVVRSTGWGLWVHAIDLRRGDTGSHGDVEVMLGYFPVQAEFDHLWRILALAWLGENRLQRIDKKQRTDLVKLAQVQIDGLQAAGMQWLAQLAQDAKAVIEGKAPATGIFAHRQTEHWREILGALEALGADASPSTEEAQESRLLWSLDIRADGRLTGIVCYEQKKGIRAWSKPRMLSFAKVGGNPRLSPWDAKVANCLRVDPYNRRNRILDLAKAVQALVGHPAIVLTDNLEQLIELSEGTPSIEVCQEKDHIELRITPSLQHATNRQDDFRAYYYDEAQKRDDEALRNLCLIQESPQRVRLVRFSPAQRRAVQLLSEKIRFPVSAQTEVQAAVQALSRHFQVQTDDMQAAREVEAESRLRAELSPVGDGLALRLVVAPLGVEGPRLIPGAGRNRFMASIKGESVGTHRQLDVERSHLDRVLEALPWLSQYAVQADLCEWEVTQPEDALSLLEALPTLPAIAALDWPKGKAVRVQSLEASQIEIKVQSRRDWFRLQGKAELDEGLVLTLEALLQASQSSSRFIALGEGRYLALTRKLKERLADLASVAESHKDGLLIPHMAALWLSDALDDTQLQADAGFQQAITRLQEAQELEIPLPRGLQAELRSYQEDGFRWAARLAHAGFGACLADDMGLGKTLQALALLVQRAEKGPALVVAPTSVCGNWIQEATRFAPSLRVHLYSEADRSTLVEQVSAFDLVIVSYTMLQQAAKSFAAKTWHTLVVDEAQAIKNANAKRSQAVFALPSDFRIALSGTPVENRLAELWSILRFTNPGLLGSLAQFNDRFAIPIERDQHRDAQRRLKRLIAPFLLRRTKGQVLQELPPRTELLIQVVPDKAEAAHYEALRRQAITDIEGAMQQQKAGQARMNILAQLTRLRRAACDPRIVTKAFPQPGNKIQTFLHLATELIANGHKALVFSQFVDFLQLLREGLDAACITYQYLDGATPAAERTRRVAEFQKGSGDLFLISLKAGGFGLNLTAADYVIITDPWWNPAAEEQAMGRAHRMGQQKPVTVYRLVTKSTLEEQIVALHQEKRALADSILADGEGTSLPSTEELIALIRGE